MLANFGLYQYLQGFYRCWGVDKMFPVRNIVLALFLSFTVHYYFLRFQWGWDTYVVVFQALMLVSLSAIGIVILIHRMHALSHQDCFYLIVIIYSLILLSLSCLRGGMPALLYGAKDYVLPIMLLPVYKMLLSENNKRFIYYIVASLGFLVSIIYLSEFINNFILMQGYFTYTEGIRDLMVAKGFSGIVETGFEKGEMRFSRMPGPISHSSSTGLMIAIGLLAALPLKRKKIDLIPQLIILVSFVCLILCGARTVWISCLVGYAYYQRLNFTSFVVTLLASLSVILMFSVYNPAITELINVSRFFNTMGDILQKAEILELSNILNIFLGLGFNYPGMLESEPFLFRPILEDDFFALQLFSMYGFFPLLFFVCYVFMKRKDVDKHIYEDKYWRAGKAILLCFLISAVHTNALVRPQLFPIFILFVVVVDQIRLAYTRPLPLFVIK